MSERIETMDFSTISKPHSTISKPHLIFCEGADEFWFLVHFLNSAELKETSSFFSNDIQVINFGGNEDLPQKLEVLTVSPGFSSVKSLLIIRDAERNAEQAVSQIVRSLERLQLPAPRHPGVWESGKIKVGFLLFPACNNSASEGTLEDLCLSVLKDADSSAAIEEIRTFIARLKSEHHRPFPREQKNQLHTYFSITDKYVGMKIGEAAKAHAFDWNSYKLQYFKTFLLEAVNTH